MERIKEEFRGLEDEYRERVGVKSFSHHIRMLLVYIYLFVGVYLVLVCMSFWETNIGIIGTITGLAFMIMSLIISYGDSTMENEMRTDYIARTIFLIEKENEK